MGWSALLAIMAGRAASQVASTVSGVELDQYGPAVVVGALLAILDGIEAPTYLTDSDGNVWDIAGSQTYLRPIPLCNGCAQRIVKFHWYIPTILNSFQQHFLN